MYIAIVDDLETDRENLKKQISENFAANGADAEFLLYDSGEAFLAEYRAGLFSAVFLDVLMGGISGIEVAKKIRETERRLPIIITTTEPDFALDGFDVHVMDFLVKPITARHLAWCLRELREYAAVPTCVEVREASGQGNALPRVIAFDDILYVQSDNHGISIRTVSGDVRIRTAFQDFLPLLPKNGRFSQCGRGLAVNFSQTQSIQNGMLLLKNGEYVPISRRQQAKVREAFINYTFFRTRKGGWG